MQKANSYRANTKIAKESNMVNLTEFQNKRIVIIGASAGIGKQVAIALSEMGANLILVARRESKLKETLTALCGGNHTYYVTDISKAANLETLFSTINEEQGLIDGLVYCAGVNSVLPLRQLRPEKLQEVFQVNVFSFIEVVRQATKRGRFNKGLRIVAISSNAAIRGDKAHTAYSASKAAMNAAVRCLAKELADKDIRVNTVSPAVTNTEMYQKYVQNVARASEQSLLDRQYLGLIEPENVADAVIFLLSSATSKVTGIILPVDGGLSTS